MTQTDVAPLRTDEESANAINKIVKDQGGPPEMPLPPGGAVTLHTGLPRNGGTARDAVVREMNGFDEEAVAKIAVSNGGNLTKIIDTIVQRCTESVGGEALGSADFANMTLGDRDELYLGIIEATFGDSKTFTIECKSCSEPNDIVFSLRDDIKRRSDPSPTFDRPVALPSGKIAVLHPVRVCDGEKVFDGSDRTAAEQNTLLLAQCVVSVDGIPVQSLLIMQALGVKDRRALVQAIEDAQAGPTFGEHEVPCAHCSEPLRFTVSGGDLL
jgi:hypothetical protein